MWSRYRNAGRPAYLAFAIAAAGMALRGILSAFSTGTNDIILWDDFAHYASLEGVLWMYRNVPAWNHPPLTGYLAGRSCGCPCSRVSVFPSCSSSCPSRPTRCASFCCGRSGAAAPRTRPRRWRPWPSLRSARMRFW